MTGATTTVRVQVCRYTTSDSVSDSSELTIGYFSLLLLGVVLGPPMFAVTSGYFGSEKVLFVWERRLLADREVDVNRLKIDCWLTCELQ